MTSIYILEALILLMAFGFVHLAFESKWVISESRINESRYRQLMRQYARDVLDGRREGVTHKAFRSAYTRYLAGSQVGYWCTA